MRATARALSLIRARIRFQAWAARLRFKLWRCGGRLILDAPHGAGFDTAPALKVFPGGHGSGATVLRLGRDVQLGDRMTIELHARADNELQVGDVARFMNGVRLVLRGGSITIGDHATIRDGAWMKTDGRLEIGAQALIGPGTSLHCSRELTLGNRIGLAENVSILDSDHDADGSNVHWRDRPLRISPVRIADNVLISAGAVILRGARIGSGSVIGANAVVRGGDYEPGSVITGNPGQVAKVLEGARSSP